MEALKKEDKPLLAGLSCNLDSALLEAALPLLEQEKVSAAEWSFDTLFYHKSMPSWFVQFLEEFGRSGRLLGHGVYFSLLSGGWSGDQEKWLTDLAEKSKRFRFDHVSEHFGFLTGKDFHQGAPLPVPLTQSVLALGQDRLKRIAAVVDCPVGVENLAFAFTPESVKAQGEFLNELVEPVNGFIVLDLHNIFCQQHNFNVAVEDLLSCYPLERVREIHISGGSWQTAYSDPQWQIRRDTHDDKVPEEVFKTLDAVINRCPNLRYVMLEQMGRALRLPEQQLQFRADFNRMLEIIETANQTKNTHKLNNFLLGQLEISAIPLVNETLRTGQETLARILENCYTLEDARSSLLSSQLAQSHWNVEQWPDDILETAIRIAQKWKNGFNK